MSLQCGKNLPCRKSFFRSALMPTYKKYQTLHHFFALSRVLVVLSKFQALVKCRHSVLLVDFGFVGDILERFAKAIAVVHFNNAFLCRRKSKLVVDFGTDKLLLA